MKILFIQTGGTIDKDYPKTNDGYAFEIGEPAFKRVLNKALVSFEYEVVSLLRKDSLDMTDEDRAKLKSYIVASPFTKIIVTHGSDTMPDTARFLGTIENKTIILTGSYKPERFKDSDADFNIGTAIGAMNVLREGTFIAMNGSIMPPENCHKNPDNGLFELKK